MVIIQPQDFDAGQLLDHLRARTAGRAGGIVSFVGSVRDYAEHAATKSLFLDHYPGMCEREIESLCAQAKQRWRVFETVVVHRIGELQSGEQIVFVGVASAHRGDAFRACEYIIDALKTRAPFWKRETLDSGEQFWVTQHDSDRRKTEQWTDPGGTAGADASAPGETSGPDESTP